MKAGKSRSEVRFLSGTRHRCGDTMMVNGKSSEEVQADGNRQYRESHGGEGAAARRDSARFGVPLHFIFRMVQEFGFRSLQKEVWNRTTDEIREKEGEH